MRLHVPRRFVAALGVGSIAAAVFASSALAGGDPIVVQSSGTTSFAGKGSVGPLPTGPTREWRGPKRTGSSPLQSNQLSNGPDLQGGSGGPATGRPRAKSNPQLLLDWEGVNHLDQRTADGGNQFSGEPPDQGICAGNGFVLESVNSALRVYSADTGAAVSPVLSLNEFYGFPSAFTRPAGPFGPFTFDISCHYDPDSNRWLHLAVDLDQDPVTGDFTGKNYLDLAEMSGGETELMHHGDRYPSYSSYGVASYYKPATVLVALRGVVGRETFHKALTEYIRRWQYKHPSPYDFFHTFEDVSGKDLSWFWRTWFFETWKLDQAIDTVTPVGDSLDIVVENRGRAVMPVPLAVTRTNGQVERVTLSVETWFAGTRRRTVRVARNPAVKTIEIDSEKEFPDLDRSNQVWPR